MNMPGIIQKIYSTEHMVKEELKRGEITPTREAYKDFLHIALPSIAEMVSIAVIGMADMAMVGRLGPYAVAAVGLTNQPRMIFMAVFFALNIAVTAIVSRRKGEDKRDEARLCVRQALIIEVLLAALMSFLSVTLAGRMMWLAGANSDTMQASTDYFKVLGMGLAFSVMSGTICAAQRGVGNTRITMYVNITANVVNVIFNFLLIEGRFGFPRLEVKGAAIATVIGTAVGFFLALFSLLRKGTYLHVSVKDNWRPHMPTMKGIMKITGGSMLEQVAFRTGFFAYARIVAGLGTYEFAAHQIAMQLMGLSFTFADGIGVASTALVGQNLGRKRPDLSIMSGKIGQRLALSIAVVLSIISFFCRFLFPLVFTNDAEIIQMTALLIIVLACILPIQTSQLVMAGSLRGAGDTRFVAMTMMVTVALIRPCVSVILIFGFKFGLIGAWLAIVTDQAVRLVMLFTRFSRGKWINIKV